MRSYARSSLVSVVGKAGVLAAAGCFISRDPAPRHGALAGAADSVAAVGRLACRNPRQCFTHAGDTTLFYESDDRGEVSVVGREWPVDSARLLPAYDAAVAAVERELGPGDECLAPHGPGRRWRDGTLHVALDQRGARLTFSRRLRPLPCGQLDEPARWL
jgi:choline dehydrogenase-like flavoprotein